MGEDAAVRSGQPVPGARWCRRHAHDRPVEGPAALAAVEGCCALGEHAAVFRDHPVATGERGGAGADDTARTAGAGVTRRGRRRVWSGDLGCDAVVVRLLRHGPGGGVGLPLGGDVGVVVNRGVNDDRDVGGQDLAHREGARLIDGHGRTVRAHHEDGQVADVRPMRRSAPVVVAAGRREGRTGTAAHVVHVHPMEAGREERCWAGCSPAPRPCRPPAGTTPSRWRSALPARRKPGARPTPPDPRRPRPPAWPHRRGLRPTRSQQRHGPADSVSSRPPRVQRRTARHRGLERR